MCLKRPAYIHHWRVMINNWPVYAADSRILSGLETSSYHVFVKTNQPDVQLMLTSTSRPILTFARDKFPSYTNAPLDTAEYACNLKDYYKFWHKNNSCQRTKRTGLVKLKDLFWSLICRPANETCDVISGANVVETGKLYAATAASCYWWPWQTPLYIAARYT